jgi:type III restriction enzyme
MVKKKLEGIGETSLILANSITEEVNTAWEDGSLLDKVSPITEDLLKFWFNDEFCETRTLNYHVGQKQAILNLIYLHEVLGIKNVKDLYFSVNLQLLQEIDLLNIEKEKYKHPKYAVKMATGTGKTWIMSALLIWQYLNAKHEERFSGLFSKNFLLVAPGLIVYERLLDACLGKGQIDGSRDFETSDFAKYESLFIPPAYRQEVFGFVKTNVVKKEEIGTKVTGEGLIAITNWHLLAGEEDEEPNSPLDDPSTIIDKLLPIVPGKSAGLELNSLDNQYLRGNEIEYLAELPNLVVFNDEAHHIHEVRKGDQIFEVQWQKSLLQIAENKKEYFMQIDFSATPYSIMGSGPKRTKHYFPHIIADFSLKQAIQQGLVKTIALDKRKEIASIELDFKAERDEDGKTVLGLSEGQKVMLRAGLKKLNILEKEFIEFTKDENGFSNKYPKMFVMCEDTKVAPFITEFLIKFEGLSEDDVIEIHSDIKGNIKKEDWEQYKQKLFNIDQQKQPRVIVSVLMLREGFDVNNICVIVPLRATSSNILLEQTIGRGLRLMWREPELIEIKNENRIKLLQKKQAPSNYLDLLSIVEHPAFIEFYDDLIREGTVGELTDDPTSRQSILGDIIKVELKSGYEDYDLYIPHVVQDKEETLIPKKLSFDNLKSFETPLEYLKKIIPQNGDVFYSEEITVKTRFGEYSITSDIFTAKNYNDLIAKIVKSVTSLLVPTGERNERKTYPLMQVNTAEIARLTDEYIKYKLFNQEFAPLKDNNWRILLLAKSGIVTHIISNISKEIYELQNSINVSEAKVIKRYFSEVTELKMRENFSVNVSKSIYEKLPYPSNKGGFELNFIEFVDMDSNVDAFIKVSENHHDFAFITYVREDGLLSHYCPDFIVKIEDNVYIVETKASKDIKNPNVRQKMLATVDWTNKINELVPEERMNSKWYYVLLDETTFYTFKKNGASANEIFKYKMVTETKE